MTGFGYALEKNEKILFVGNRKFVLDELLKKIDLDILAIKNTHLERDLKNKKYRF